MVVTLLSKDNKKELTKRQKGPLLVHPTGKWRAIEFVISNYETSGFRYIKFCDSGASENDNITRVAGTTIQLGYRSGGCMEVFSLPHQDNGERTCYLHLNLHREHGPFKKLCLEYSSLYSYDESDMPQKISKPIGTESILFNIPTTTVHIKVLAVGKDSATFQELGEAVLPPTEGK